jgi:hypothetical protein
VIRNAQETTLTVTVDPVFEPMDVDESVTKDSSVYLMVVLEKGAHIPVMDGMLEGGKCDPYCQVLLKPEIRAAGCCLNPRRLGGPGAHARRSLHLRRALH